MPLLRAPSLLLTTPIILIARLISFHSTLSHATSYIYIGEADRRLGDRIRYHLYDILKSDTSKPVFWHFNCSNHYISNFVAFSLSVINGGNDCRKTKEMQFIHDLGALNPHGINERFTFNHQ